MSVKMIFARDLDHGIGKDNGLAWSLPEDLKYFKEQTVGKTIIMGLNTWNSLLCRPLPNRKNVILTKQRYKSLRERTKELDNVIVIEDILDYVRFNPDEEIWLIGGTQLFHSCKYLVNEIHETVVFDRFDCDVFISKNITEGFKLVSQSAIRYSKKSKLEYRINVYTKD